MCASIVFVHPTASSSHTCAPSLTPYHSVSIYMVLYIFPSHYKAYLAFCCVYLSIPLSDHLYLDIDLPVHQPVCRSIYLSIHLYLYLYLILSVTLSIAIFESICLSVSPCVNVSIHLHLHLHLHVHLSVYPIVRRSIHPSIATSISVVSLSNFRSLSHPPSLSLWAGGSPAPASAACDATALPRGPPACSLHLSPICTRTHTPSTPCALTPLAPLRVPLTAAASLFSARLSPTPSSTHTQTLQF